MICDVCGSEIREGAEGCTRCGYPVIGMVGNSPELMEQRRALARDYARQLIQDLMGGFIAYSHKVTKDAQGNEKLELDRADEVPFCRIEALEIGETRWKEEGFLHPQSTVLDMTIYFRQKQKFKKQAIRFAITPGGSDCFIGLKRTGPVNVRVCLRYDTTTIESEDICAL